MDLELMLTSLPKLLSAALVTLKLLSVSLVTGLFVGLLFFPSPDFSKSILIGVIFSIDIFPLFLSQSLLFTSFLAATFLPIVTWKIK